MLTTALIAFGLGLIRAGGSSAFAGAALLATWLLVRKGGVGTTATSLIPKVLTVGALGMDHSKAVYDD